MSAESSVVSLGTRCRFTPSHDDLLSCLFAVSAVTLFFLKVPDLSPEAVACPEDPAQGSMTVDPELEKALQAQRLAEEALQGLQEKEEEENTSRIEPEIGEVNKAMREVGRLTQAQLQEVNSGHETAFRGRHSYNFWPPLQVASMHAPPPSARRTVEMVHMILNPDLSIRKPMEWHHAKKVWSSPSHNPSRNHNPIHDGSR